MSSTDHTTSGPCFPPDEVRSLLLGQVTGAAAERLARHLPTCSRCSAVADAVSLDSGVVSDLRREHLPPPPSEHELADVIARVSRIGPVSSVGRPGGSRPSPDVPGRLGTYRLVALLGVGGMGVVYRAEDLALHRFVAVKVVRDGANASTRSRFLSEARALAAVRHDNVVTVHSVGEEPTAGGPVPYLAMELLEGQTLRDWATSNPVPPVAWVVRVGRQITAGLAFAHGAGLVHRDIKPANLWLEAPQGWANQAVETRPALADVARVKLLDFGLAHAPGVSEGAGTPAYMAPEQARGEAVDARTDLFGLGCVLYELCTGKLPFPERTRRQFDNEAPPAPVRSLNPAVPDRFADLIGRLLAADSADRPVSARAVELELAALDARPAGVPTVSGRADATITIRPDAPRRRHHLVVAAALLAGGAVTAAALITQTDTGAPRPEILPPPAPAVATHTDPTAERPLAPNVIDDEWCRAIAAQPPQQQLTDVIRALGGLNPKYDWTKGSGWVESYGVIRITINADEVTDLRPVRALTGLSVVRCRGSATGLGILTDLLPLSDLKLKEFHCRNNPKLRDLSAIRLDGLEFLDAAFTDLDTLAGLTGAPLVTLKISGTPIRDLGPVRKMPKLRALDCTGCPIADFEPLTTVPLRELTASVQTERDAAALKRIKTLERINGKSAREFWKTFSASVPK